MDVDGYKIVNVYKPPPTRLQSLDLPVFPHSCLFTGDFNCRRVDWGYNNNNPDGECLAGWASINNLALLYNAKDPPVFTPAAGTLAPIQSWLFASVGLNSRSPDKQVPQVTTSTFVYCTTRFALSVPSMPVKQWNFLKAKWSHYIALTNKFKKNWFPSDSLSVDEAYQDFYNIIKKEAKKTIPCGYRTNYIPCWDAECEFLYKSFLESR